VKFYRTGEYIEPKQGELFEAACGPVLNKGSLPWRRPQWILYCVPEMDDAEDDLGIPAVEAVSETEASTPS
jgi:hypothetical protein